MISRKQIEGVGLLLLAMLFFWFPGYMQKADFAEAKILVATPELDGGVFEKTVVLVTKHNGYGAQGFILNKPSGDSSEPANGGPLEKDKIYTLHSLDIDASETEKLRKMDIGLTEGQDFVYNLEKRTRKPEGYRVVKGTAVWARNQLNDEVTQGLWKMIAFDRALLFSTPPNEIYAVASRK